ncbi:two-component system sensor histidine kinase CreC [Agarilytica rhodophyticola]|uniref:two-component system sensor histidine kinase CreC n=1 Tax=Agarilytica rhodophyticola TaxID=1737490 RepID=UPI000B342776|nr:two-component system sensor histidine kinase CreC [Agarilytica rhodophyticola]
MKLTFASRIFAGYFIVVGIAAWFLVNTLVEEIKPVVRQSVEYTLADTSNILAEILKEQVARGAISPNIQSALDNVKARELDAKIWGFPKKNITLNFYVTNKYGTVIYDSAGRHQGKDFSKWRDVYLTLRGKYGARSTQEDPNDPFSTVMHVAAPILKNSEIIGVVTTYTPNISLQPFLDTSRQSALRKGMLLLFISLIVGGFISYWLSQAISQLVKYAEKVKLGERVKLPKLGRGELNQLVLALESMRRELEGKHYVEQYVQQLTHELKSPVAAIKGAAELISVETPVEIQQRFLSNIQQQSDRIESIINKMLYLSALENTNSLEHSSDVNIVKICQTAINQKKAKADTKSIKLEAIYPELNAETYGDQALLQLAVDNLLDNAIDFGFNSTTIIIEVVIDQKFISVHIQNQGEHIPDYALNRVYERFYSLPRPEGAPKSTGLGLSFVLEVVNLHHGRIVLNNVEGGVMAALDLPKEI